MDISQYYYDLYDMLKERMLPMQVANNNRLDQILTQDVLTSILQYPHFKEWSDSLKHTQYVAIRRGAAVPTIETRYNISQLEVPAMRECKKTINSFMKHMGMAIRDNAIPVEEVLAIIADAMYTQAWVTGNNLERVH